MSWQAYVDTSLVGSGNVDKAAIISVAGDSVWATSAGFTISAEEMKSIANILNGDQAAIDKAHAEGIHVAGERFVLIGGHLEGNIYGRGQERRGVAISKSKQAILIAHHDENSQPGNTTNTVEVLKDYLVGQGY